MSLVFPVGQATAQGGSSVYTTGTGIFGASIVHVFTTNSSFTTTVAISTVSYLVVGGGGAGSGGRRNCGNIKGGGGGGGGFQTGTFALLSSATTYTVTIGQGGYFQAPLNGNCGGGPGLPGTASSISGAPISTITSAGGGGAAPGSTSCAPAGPTYTGASGGTAGSGSAGGTGGGAGGGAGGAGSGGPPAFACPTAGGIGAVSIISGTAQYYAGGGGGGYGNNPGGLGGGGPGALVSVRSGTAGTPGTGGGGGAAVSGSGSGCSFFAGNGGPGIVIISYPASGTLGNAYVYTATTYLGTETWTWNTATQRWWSTSEPSQQYTIRPSLIEDQGTTATNYLDFPYGTTAQRPASPSIGYMRFNTDLGLMEYYNNLGAWIQIPQQLP